MKPAHPMMYVGFACFFISGCTTTFLEYPAEHLKLQYVSVEGTKYLYPPCQVSSACLRAHPAWVVLSAPCGLCLLQWVNILHASFSRSKAQKCSTASRKPGVNRSAYELCAACPVGCMPGVVYVFQVPSTVFRGLAATQDPPMQGLAVGWMRFMP